MRSLIVSLSVLALVLLLIPCGGCARFTVLTGKGLASVSGLERGKTTRQEVLEAYGPPQVVDETRGALYGENHLAYEERQTEGWYIMIYLPGYGLPVFGFFTSEEQANSTIFLFDGEGRLVDYATSRAPVAKRLAWAMFAWVYSGVMIK